MPTQIDVSEGILRGVMDKVTHGRTKKHGLAGAGLHALHVPGFKHGGKVKKTGIYKLHKGEKVMTAKQSKSHPGLDC